MSKKILLFSGDPNSINSEIIFKCFKHLSSSIKKNLYHFKLSTLKRAIQKTQFFTKNCKGQ